MRYLEVVFDEGIAKPQLQQLAADAGVDRATVSQWRHHTPGFNEWFNALIDRAVLHARSRVTGRLAQLAETGSIEHMKLFLALTAPKSPAATPLPGGTSPLIGAVIVNLPIPPTELQAHPIVRGLLEGAVTIDALPAGL